MYYSADYQSTKHKTLEVHSGDYCYQIYIRLIENWKESASHPGVSEFTGLAVEVDEYVFIYINEDGFDIEIDKDSVDYVHYVTLCYFMKKEINKMIGNYNV